jgi:hypothetical protein
MTLGDGAGRTYTSSGGRVPVAAADGDTLAEATGEAADVIRLAER